VKELSIVVMFDAVLVGCGVFLLSLVFFLVWDWIVHRQLVRGGPGGRYVLITGCDSGFGKHAAQRLDAAGCHVIGTCLMAEGASALRDVCSSHLTAVQMDVTDEASIQQAFTVVTDLLQPNKGLCSRMMTVMCLL